MAKVGDLEVTIRANDQVTPVIRRIRAEYWLLQHGRFALSLGAILIATLAFLLGVAVTVALR